MAKRDRPAQQAGEGNGGGYQVMEPPAQWQPQQQPGQQGQQQQPGPPPHQPFEPPTPEERGMYEAAPGRALPRSFQAPGFPPPPSNKTPAGISGLAVPLPIGTKATHFSGPIVSGGIPQVPTWSPRSQPPVAAPPVAGTAVLTTTLAIDYSMGNFTAPVQFPSDALITGFATITAVQFTAPPSFQLGTTSGASDIAGGSFPAPGGPTQFQPATGQLPLWTATPPQSPFQAFLTVAGNTGGTAGLGLILIQYVRIPQKWT